MLKKRNIIILVGIVIITGVLSTIVYKFANSDSNETDDKSQPKEITYLVEEDLSKLKDIAGVNFYLYDNFSMTDLEDGDSKLLLILEDEVGYYAYINGEKEYLQTSQEKDSDYNYYIATNEDGQLIIKSKNDDKDFKVSNETNINEMQNILIGDGLQEHITKKENVSFYDIQALLNGHNGLIVIQNCDSCNVDISSILEGQDVRLLSGKNISNNTLTKWLDYDKNNLDSLNTFTQYRKELLLKDEQVKVDYDNFMAMFEKYNYDAKILDKNYEEADLPIIKKYQEAERSFISQTDILIYKYILSFDNVNDLNVSNLKEAIKEFKAINSSCTDEEIVKFYKKAYLAYKDGNKSFALNEKSYNESEYVIINVNNKKINRIVYINESSNIEAIAQSFK